MLLSHEHKYVLPYCPKKPLWQYANIKQFEMLQAVNAELQSDKLTSRITYALNAVNQRTLKHLPLKFPCKHD